MVSANLPRDPADPYNTCHGNRAARAGNRFARTAAEMGVA